MWQKLRLLFNIPELRRKILFVLGVLGLFRAIAAIPVPGVDPARLTEFFQQNQLFGLLNLFTGGALSNLSIVMLGVGPYITATIIMQLLTMIFPRIKEIYYEEGEAGRARFNQYSRLLTVPLASLQGFGLLRLLENQEVFPPLGPAQLIQSLVVVVAGSILLMWLGELVSEKGIGNGISLLIFAGIIADIPSAIRQTLFAYNPSQIPNYALFALVAVAVIAGVVFVSEAQRLIPVMYSKQVRGMRLFGGVSTYLPLRVNQAGVIPIIFALSILLFPQMIAQILGASGIAWLARLAGQANFLLQNLWLYGGLYFLLVVIFTFFYTMITFEPHEIASNLQRAGGFLPGMRPGKPTADLLSFLVHRVTLFGALFLGAIAVLPIALQGATGIATLTIGGTAVLIVVSVVLETMKQIEAQLAMRAYE